MNVVNIRIWIVACAAILGCTSPALGADDATQISYKLNNASAKGDLTDRQIIGFRSQLEAVKKSSRGAQLEKQLQALSEKIDRTRKPKRIATRLFGIF